MAPQGPGAQQHFSYGARERPGFLSLAGQEMVQNPTRHSCRRHRQVQQVAMMSEDGTRVFFQSPDPLVGADVNGEPDVYEWENGHVYLISGGNAPTPSYYVDNSGTGGDVFFVTAQGLIPSDEDEQN